MADWIYNQRPYKIAKAQLMRALRAGTPYACWVCGQPATSPDHVPPVHSAASPQAWVGELRPACGFCQSSTGATYGNNRRRQRAEHSREW
jgi:hypothetical protein